MFNVENLLISLPVMGKGMAGVFVVTLVIVAVVSLLNKLGNGIK